MVLQLEDGSKKGGNLRLFPPADRPTLEFHLNTMMQEVAASLLMEFEKWVLQAESSGTILKTPLDSQASLSSEEVFMFRCPDFILIFCIFRGVMQKLSAFGF